MVCIIISTLTLALEEPLEDPKSNKLKVIKNIDKVTTTIFTIEAVLKIIAHGFILNGKKSYLRNSWNILDFIIVVSALLSLTSDSDIGFFKVLRILRVLRPLRLITRVKGLKLVIGSLMKAVPRIINLQMVVLFFMYTFAILMTTLFSGKSDSCSLSHSNLSKTQREFLIKTKWDCLNYGGEWQSSYINFDNSFRSMILIFVIQTGERFGEIYSAMINAVAIDY